jgi:hypothetical protein
MFLKEIGLHAQNLVINPSSIVNIIRVIYMIIQEDNSHFVDELNIYMSSKNHENGYNLD